MMWAVEAFQTPSWIARGRHHPSEIRGKLCACLSASAPQAGRQIERQLHLKCKSLTSSTL